MAARPPLASLFGQAETRSVSADIARRPRVLLGDLEPIMRVGMSRILTAEGVDVVEDAQRSGIVSEAASLSPDAVILDLAEGAGRELGDQVRAAAPQAKVILWARDESEMEVFEPGSSTSRHIHGAVRDALLIELTAGRSLRTRREKE
jgi:CheY-like chemotaxis protein